MAGDDINGTILVVAILEAEHESPHQSALIGAVCQSDAEIGKVKVSFRVRPELVKNWLALTSLTLQVF